jgi:hypothetical protein
MSRPASELAHLFRALKAPAATQTNSRDSHGGAPEPVEMLDRPSMQLGVTGRTLAD